MRAVSVHLFIRLYHVKKNNSTSKSLIFIYLDRCSIRISQTQYKIIRIFIGLPSKTKSIEVTQKKINQNKIKRFADRHKVSDQ